MQVTITVNNVWSRLSGLKNNVELIDMLDKKMSYYVEGYRFTRAFMYGYRDKDGQWRHWDGKRHLLTRRMVFPTGLLQRVKKFLEFHNISFTVDDRRVQPLGDPLAVIGHTPRPYQQEAADAAFEAGRGIIRIGTGGGKTHTAAMMIARHNVPSMIYVIGKDLLYQFHEELVKALGPDDVGIIGDGLCDVRRFNVCSIWTAVTAFDLKSKTVSLDDEDWQPEIIDLNTVKKGEIKRAVTNSALAVFDEAHFIACDTIQSIFKASKNCRYMFGLTGTDWRDDGADILLESVCGERIYNAKSSTLIDQGYLVPPKIVMLEMPKHPDITKKMTWSEVYSRYITHNDDRNEAVVKSAKQLISMGRKVLILVRYLKHGKNLVDMMEDVSVLFVSGELDGEARRDVKKRFEAGEIQCLVASSVFDIGVDIPSLDALVLAGGGKSTVRALQRIGRVIRLSGESKKDALVVDFIDNAKYLDKHSATRITVYETEPRFQIKFPEGFKRGSLRKIRKVKAKIR